METIDTFLNNYSDCEGVYSKIYHYIKTNDNFLKLPSVLVPDGYKLYDSDFYYLIANEDQFPDYSNEKKKKNKESEKGLLEASREWDSATGLKNLCLFK